MTDTTTTTEEPAESAAPVETAPATPPAPTTPERGSFWDRPYVDRFLTPLVLPVAVIVGLVFFVLNVSRLFLSVHGHIPVVVGSVITGAILIGATLLSGGAGRLRSSSIILLTVGFIVIVAFGGWISVGHSENKEAAASTLPPTLKTTQTIKFTEAPGGNLTFVPDSENAKTGLATIEVNFAAAGHTLAFHDPDVMFAEIKPTAPGPEKGTAFFPKAGDYAFYCTVPGHEAAGMHGTIHVTGPTMTIDEALKAAGNPPLPG
jgi:plastocyanin